MASKKRVLLVALLAAFLLAAVAPSRPALADITYLDGEITERQAAIEYGIYAVFSASTGRAINGYDYENSPYSDTNLSMIHEWNQDLREFNSRNGDAAYAPWPVSEVTDVVFVPTAGIPSQYNALYYQIGQEYDLFKTRYPNADMSDWLLDFGAITNPTRALLGAFALTSSTKQYGDVSENAAWYNNIVWNIEPQYRFEYNGVPYHISSSQDTFDALMEVVNGNVVHWAGELPLEALPIYLVAVPDTLNRNVCLIMGHTGSRNLGYSGENIQVFYPQEFNITDNVTISPSRQSFRLMELSYNNGTYRYGSNSVTSLKNILNAIVRDNYLLIPIRSSQGFVNGGGEMLPGNNGGNYICIPNPTNTVSASEITNNGDGTISIGNQTFNSNQYIHNGDTYTVVNTGATGYEVTDEPPEIGVTDTNDGLSWLGSLMNLVIDTLGRLISAIGNLGKTLLEFVTEFVIGDLDNIDLESLKLPELNNVFPFSIPWDIANILNVLSAEPLAPEFTWPISNVDGTELELTVSLADFSPVMETVRTCEVVAFVVGLAVMTRKLLG